MVNKNPTNKKKFRQLPVYLLVAIDVLLIGAALIVFALFDHALPRAMDSQISAETQALLAQQALKNEQQAAQQPDQPVQTAQPQPTAVPFGVKFADKFTDGEPYQDGNSYVGRNLNVTFSTGQMGGSVYFVQDIYVRDIECLRTAFGKDTYGKNYTEDAAELANRKGAIGAINGDYYCAGSLNVVVRNGEMYRDTVDPFESMLALYRDGTMEVYENGEFTVAELIERGVWQTWSFGPQLLTEDGQAISKFNLVDPGVNPRTVIGMAEPGHYIFLAVDGRQPGYSEGMGHEELSQLCFQLGMTVAYNLDGGDTTKMIFGGQYVNSPSGDREIPDIIYVVDSYE